MLGMSERSFRRYRRRYEDDGLDGLFDRRLDKASRAACRPTGSNGCSAVPNPPYGLDGQALPRPSLRPPWLRLELHLDQDHLAARRPVSKAPRRGAHRRRRPRKPCVGMMLHQDGSRHEWLAGQAACDLIVTMDDATSEIYSAFLVEEEGTASTFRALKQVFTDKGLPSSLYTDRGLLPCQGSTRRRSSARAHRATGPSAGHPPPMRWRGSDRFSNLPTTTAAPTPPELDDSAFVPLEHPGQIDHPLSPHRPHSRPRQHRALRKARPPDPRHPSQTPLSRPGSGSTPRAPSLARPTASPSKPQPGRPRHAMWTAAPRLTTSPQGRNNRSGHQCATKTGQIHLLATEPVPA